MAHMPRGDDQWLTWLAAHRHPGALIFSYELSYQKFCPHLTSTLSYGAGTTGLYEAAVARDSALHHILLLLLLLNSLSFKDFSADGKTRQKYLVIFIELIDPFEAILISNGYRGIFPRG
jgi:hypothetical protein